VASQPTPTTSPTDQKTATNTQSPREDRTKQILPAEEADTKKAPKRAPKKPKTGSRGKDKHDTRR
jgi:hypothetical protein